MRTSVNTFHAVDYAVFGVTVVLSIGIGIYYALHGGRKKTTSEYLLGGRLINYFPVAISLLVSFESSIMMLGFPAEGYFFGTQLLINIIGATFTYIVAVYLVCPIMHPLKITSSYEYLELRFNSRAVRMLGTVLGISHYLVYIGIVLYGPAVALEAVTGLPQWASIIIISIVSIIYTSIGGLKAVIWTDVLQAVLMLTGIFSVLIKGTLDVGGAKKVWDIAMEGKRLELFNFDPDPTVRHTFWCLVIGTGVRYMSINFNQSTIQRISSTRSVKEAQKVVWVATPMFVLITIVGVYEGVVAYAYYQQKGCDPMESGAIKNPNQLLPYFVLEIFEGFPGMPGLFLASLFSASLSTLSTCLSSMSALVWADIVRPMLGNDVTEWKGAIIAKAAVLVLGCIACGIAFMVSLIGGTLNQIAGSTMSAIICPATSLFLMACFIPRITARGALVGGIAGIVMSCWVSFGMNFSPAVIPTPMLTPASTDQCDVIHSYSYNMNEHLSSMTTTSMTMNITIPNITTTTTTTTIPTTSTTHTQVVPSPQGVEYLYNLSYQWLSLIGTFTPMVVAYIFSLITGPNRPGDVDPRYLASFSKTILFPLPSSVQNWLASFGTQFIKEEYKANFSDPAMREKVLLPTTEMELTPFPPPPPQDEQVLELLEKGSHSNTKNDLPESNK